MTGDQLSALMLQAIETEAAKPAKEINDAWLTACSELMASADQDKLAKVSDHAQRIRSKLVEAIRKDQKVQQRRLAYRMATAAACFLIIFAGVSFSKQWFRATQSPDEQVYNLLGQQVEIQTGNQAAADGDEAWRECETTSFQELCDFLGYVPQIPTWVPNGWVLNRYYASIDGESRSITAVYAKAGVKNALIYNYLQADDISNFSVDFYQDGTGDHVQLQNGLDIYLTTNTDDPVAVWTTASTYTKVYDPSNEFDEEYFEFGLFMSRREYKTINRRLIRGRESSASEGKYLGSIAPYGYNRVKLPNDKGYTLEPHPTEAEVVKRVFAMFLAQAGTKAIANALNDMRIPTRHGDLWTYSTISQMVTNPVYAGKIRRGWSQQIKSVENGVVKKRIKRHKNTAAYKTFEGLHPALVSEEDFQLAQQIRLARQPCARVRKEFVLQNPFAGLIFCANCGKRIGRTTMSAAQQGRVRLRCVNGRNCHNVSADFDVVEREIIQALRSWLEGYRVKIDTVGYAEDIAHCKQQIDHLTREADKIQMQLENAYNLVEQGIYTLEVFRTRREKLTDSLDEIRQRQQALEEMLTTFEASEATQSSLIPQTEALLDSYDEMTNQERNALLKAILYRIEYAKGADGKIEIDLYPRLPKI